MKKKRAMAASREPEQPDYTVQYSIQSGVPPNSIIFNTGPDQEMLRVSEDGFYVRGVRVPADAQEAQTVYNAFKEFLVYHNLKRSY